VASARHCACLWALGGAARDVREAWVDLHPESAAWPLSAVFGLWCGYGVMGRVALQRDGACPLLVVCGGGGDAR